MSAVLNLVKSIKDKTGAPPCKKTVQKIAYMIQQAGDDLGLDYSIHFYGPYSADLDSEIRYLHGRGDLNIEITDHWHMLSVSDTTNISPIGQTAQSIIDKFGSKTPYELELLATTLYVQRETESAQVDGIIKGVVKIKGSKYTEDKIKTAIKELKDNNYF